MAEPSALSADLYGTPEHAAREALSQSKAAYEGYVNADVSWVAQIVVDGLRERGFIVSREPRCDCGWTGEGNHYHDNRMGRTASDEPSTSTSSALREKTK